MLRDSGSQMRLCARMTPMHRRNYATGMLSLNSVLTAPRSRPSTVANELATIRNRIFLRHLRTRQI